ncbi:MAG TPA: septation regulator SpoVG [Clostridiales bacterium]|nr:septation regulator SpoVG [Clostridiales bacterium]
MHITDVRVRNIENEGKLKATVSVTFDNEFVVHDIKVIEGEKGLFVAMPSRRTAEGEYRDISHPINSEMRERIQNRVLEKYEAVLMEIGATSQVDYEVALALDESSN